MAKDNKGNTSLEVVNTKQENLSIDNYKANALDILKDFSQLDEKYLQELTQEYLQLKENQTYNVIFTGMTTFKGEAGKEVEAVLLYDEKGNSFINGNTVLVNSLKKITVLPCVARIVTGDKVKGQNGTYLDMRVITIPNALKK